MAERTFVLLAAVIIAVIRVPNDAATAISEKIDRTFEYSEEATELQSNEAKSESSVDRRKALRDRAKLWPAATVPYFINKTLDRVSRKARQVIKDAIFHWENHTCLRFVPYDPSRHKDYINFQKGNGGCQAIKGRQGGSQYVDLGSGCLHVDIVVHEIGHAIGWSHEHKRPDRDDYIKVNWELIPESDSHSYDKNDESYIDTYGVPYDLGSIMHYRPDDGELEALNKSNEHLMGQANKLSMGLGRTLSFYDIKLANLMYKCAARNHCNEEEIFCKGEGYVGPKCNCLCPDGVESCSVGNEKRRW